MVQFYWEGKETCGVLENPAVNWIIISKSFPKEVEVWNVTVHIQIKDKNKFKSVKFCLPENCWVYIYSSVLRII